jgi:F-type H+-transporting ATPase subunit epsilon
MLQFELVSPDRKLFSAPVAMVTVPGSEGDFSVLAGNAPFIATMRVGVIDVYEKDQDITSRILVSGGLVEVNPNQCTVLAEEAIALSEVSKAGFEKDIKDLEDRLSVAANDMDKNKLQSAIKLANKKIELLNLIGQA